ncbi:MAG: hypothetical protein NTW03_03955, partial [Verrucomicrobia bacterium]|nr:hypothetical protein [Verrucomicrobiota bacterium]
MEIQGVVTFYDTGFNLFFVHDGTANIYVHWPNANEELHPGRMLEIKGLAAAGQYAPYIASPRIKLGGMAPLPQPIPAKDADLISGSLDAQWLETIGVVRTMQIIGSRLRLHVASGPVRYGVWVRQFSSNSIAGLLDSRVSLRGVLAGEINTARQMTGFQLFVTSMADIKVLEPAPSDLATTKPSMAKTLTSYEMRRHAGHRVRAQGLVAVVRSSQGFVMLDTSGAIEVQCASPTLMAAGDMVDVGGFLSF